MSRPLVSCIVPTYNREGILPDSLDSVVAQTHRPLEILVIDDGSTDRTERIVREFDHDVTYVRQENRGPAAARNVGIRHATAELLAFLDSDDIWRPDKLARQIARFEARPELEVSVTEFQNRILETGELLPASRAFALPTMMARRSVFQRVGPFDEDLYQGEGMDWYLRAVEAGVVMELLPVPLLDRVVHSGNMTSRQEDTARGEIFRYIKKALDLERRNPSAYSKALRIPLASHEPVDPEGGVP